MLTVMRLIHSIKKCLLIEEKKMREELKSLTKQEEMGFRAPMEGLPFSRKRDISTLKREEREDG